MDKVPRVDIPSDWVDFVIQSPTPYKLDPLFTRDPAKISNERIMKAMMAIKGIYAEYGVTTLNHGVGYDTAAVELLLPTFGEDWDSAEKSAHTGAESPSDTDSGD